MSMNVMVEVELDIKPKKEHWEVMQEAAEALTNDKSSVRVSTFQSKPNTLVAEFKMKKARQIDVVDRIGDRFSYDMEDYADSSIPFPRTMRKRKRNY